MSSTHSMMHGLQLDNSYGSDKTRCEESLLMKSAFLLSGRGVGMTMEEIARDMGVSRSTVSRALSGKGRIGEDTRARIREYVGRQSEAENQSTNNLAVVLPNDA